jgi:hypothetical protein
MRTVRIFATRCHTKTHSVAPLCLSGGTLASVGMKSIDGVRVRCIKYVLTLSLNVKFVCFIFPFIHAKLAETHQHDCRNKPYQYKPTYD